MASTTVPSALRIIHRHENDKAHQCQNGGICAGEFSTYLTCFRWDSLTVFSSPSFGDAKLGIATKDNNYQSKRKPNRIRNGALPRIGRWVVVVVGRVVENRCIRRRDTHGEDSLQAKVIRRAIWKKDEGRSTRCSQSETGALRTRTGEK